MAVPCLLCLEDFSLVAVSRGYFLVMVLRLLDALAALVAGHRLQSVWASGVVACGLSSYSPPGSRAQAYSHGTWA